MDPVSCLFCPSKQGAFKQTSDLHWAHLLCTNWIPEVAVGNPVFMEPIEGVANIPPSRWKLTCYICKLKVGACIQCSNKTCYTSFHVSCARRAKLFLQRNPGNLLSAGKSFCDKHVPEWYRIENDVDTAFIEAQNYLAGHTDPRTQSLNNSDAPSRGKFVVSLKRSKQSAVIPTIVFAEILLYMQKFRIRNKAETIADLCKYWSLKRRSRRGASLLKRLQLQIEDNAAQRMDESHKANRLEFAKGLLVELDKSQRPLLEDVMEREIMKKERCDMRDSVIEHVYLPLQPILHDAVAALRHIDTHNLLSSTSMAAKTADIDQLTWSEVLRRVHDAQYLSIATFETDLRATFGSILAAFPVNFSREHKLAERLLEKLPAVLAQCRSGERAKALKPTSMIATCFDGDFQPDGLILTEEKPFNWANRDTSPLSEIDDETIGIMEEPFKSEVPTHSSTPSARTRATSKVLPPEASASLAIQTEGASSSQLPDIKAIHRRTTKSRRHSLNVDTTMCDKIPEHTNLDQPSDIPDPPATTDHRTASQRPRRKQAVLPVRPIRPDRATRSVATDLQTQSRPDITEQKLLVAKQEKTADRSRQPHPRRSSSIIKRKAEDNEAGKVLPEKGSHPKKSRRKRF